MSITFPDNFVKTLWDILSEQATTIKTQQARLHHLWNQSWTRLKINLPKITEPNYNINKFLQSISIRLNYVRTLQRAMEETYNVVRTIVRALFEIYIGQGIILQDFPEQEVYSVSMKLADILVGSLLQFIATDQTPIPLAFLLIPKNKSLMKLRPLTIKRMKDDLEKNGFFVSEENISEVINELVEAGYIKQTIDPKTDETAFKFVKDFTLSPESEKKFNLIIKPLLEWTVGIWRSLYNIRSIDTPIPENYPYKDFLVETVKRAATQGYLTAHNVMENIGNYYQMILEQELEVP